MAIQLIRRPIGHKISPTSVSGTVVDNGAGDAVVYVPGGHSLSDGDYVYIESNLDSYNGFKYVDATAYDYFKIKNSENGDFIEYVQDAEATIYISLLNHGWQCVHLPIVYELSSDVYPVNEAEESYTPVVVDFFEDYGGYVKLNLSVGLASPFALNYISLIGVGDLAGTYQITSVLNPWEIVINLAYDATYDFTGYQVLNFLNNYNINVEVWAGLQSPHRWVTKKPYELAATLKFIPDSEGNVMFSVHDILKGYIETRNNLTLDTLPNNLDFHVGFYIKYYESYDLSDGGIIEREEGEVTTDSFEGHAVNAMLPFKSFNSGHLSDYINTGDDLARWLTLFDRPIAVVDRFFDISFLNQYDGVDVLIMRNGELFQTISNPGSGVIRVMFIPESGFTEYCLQAFVTGGSELNLSSFLNEDTGGPSWTLGATPSVVTNAGPPRTSWLYIPFVFSIGFEYTFSVTYNISASPAGTLGVSGLDEDFVSLDGDTASFSAGTHTVDLTIVGESGMTFLAISGGTIAPESLTILGISYVVEEFGITERICIDIVEECGTTFVNDDLRITDGDQLRRI